jgi:hypothetical protein
MGMAGQSLTGRDSYTPCDRVAFGKSIHLERLAYRILQNQPFMKRG